MLNRLLYIAACLVVPLAWGVFAWATTRWVERRLPKPKKKDERPELEYYL